MINEKPSFDPENYGEIEKVDIKEVSNEVEMYLPVKHFRFTVMESAHGPSDYNVADGVKSILSDTESG